MWEEAQSCGHQWSFKQPRHAQRTFSPIVRILQDGMCLEAVVPTGGQTYYNWRNSIISVPTPHSYINAELYEYSSLEWHKTLELCYRKFVPARPSN